MHLKIYESRFHVKHSYDNRKAKRLKETQENKYFKHTPYFLVVMLSQGVSYVQTHQFVYTKYMRFLYHFYHNKAERKRKIEGGRERDRE